MAHQDYTVDSATLAHLIARMTQCEQALEDLTNDVEHTVSQLQETWQGQAADAQRLAHAEWEKGLATMRQAIADLKADAGTAHDNYVAAGEANVAMWQDVQ